MTELLTPRLRLRPWRPEDRASFAAINAEPAVQRYLRPSTPETSIALIDRIDQHFASNGWGFWAVEERERGLLIGLCGLAHVPWDAFFTPAVEVGWRLSTRWHRRGLAREAAEAALAFAFGRLGLGRVVAYTVPENTASWALMERLGMRRLGEFDHPQLAEDDPLLRHVAYEITAEAWAGRHPDGAAGRALPEP